MTLLVVVVSVIGGLIIGAWWQKRRDAAGIAAVETEVSVAEPAADIVGRAVEGLEIGVVIASSSGDIV